MFDVVAVTIKDSKILWVMGPRDAANAEAIHNMAIMRQGVEDRFFAYAQPKQYVAGDKWEGGVELPAPEESDDGRLVKRGDMWYPNGPRGLERQPRTRRALWAVPC
jgi:hypothetical protein